jgi:hypothetical protein
MPVATSWPTTLALSVAPTVVVVGDDAPCEPPEHPASSTTATNIAGTVALLTRWILLHAVNQTVAD